MSLKMKSLGTCASAAAGILITAGAAATPWVATVTAGHRLKNGDRIAIAGITTQVGSNGEWSVASVGATTATMVGSSATGAYAGTAVVTGLMDRTPFLPGHSAVLVAADIGVTAVFVGTVLIEAADARDATQFYYTNTSGVQVAGFREGLMSGEIAIPPQTTVGGGSCFAEVALSRYMRFRCSSYTTGTIQGALMA